MRRPPRLPESLAGRPFPVADAAARELGRRRLRARDLESPFHGVRQPAGTPALAIHRAAAFAARMSPAQMFSHETAAELLGLPIPARIRDGPLHVTSVAPARAPRHPGVLGHTARVTPRFVFIGHLRVTSAVETWIALGAVLALDDLIVVGDALLRRQHPFASEADIDVALAGARGRRGYRNLVAARREMRAGVDSPRETHVRLILTRASLPAPEVNQRHYSATGSYLGRGDLAYPEWKVLIEYDGIQHFVDESQGHIDVERLGRFADDGWGIVRINRSNVDIPGYVLAKTIAALRRNGWPG